MSNGISWHVCKHELKQKAKNNTLWLLFALMQLLLAVALFTSWQQYQQSRALQISSQQLVEQQWLAQPDRHPHRVAHFGHFAFRPPSALSYFDIGVNKLGGHAVYLDQTNGAMGSREDVKDFAANISRWADCIVARVFDHNTLVEMEEFASVPVINSLCDLYHPCQGKHVPDPA